MGKLQEYYRLFDMLRGKLNDEQKSILEGLEDQLIAEEILPAISESVAPVLGTLRRPLTLVVDYDPEGGITVKTTRGEVVVKENTVKKYEIPNTSKVVKVAEGESPFSASEPNEREKEKYTRGPRVKFEVRLNGRVVPGTDGASIIAETIRQVGFERVAALNIRFVKGQYNLVDRRKRLDKNKIWQREIDGWYIYTNTANTTKAENLAEIAERLGLNMSIILESAQFYPKAK